MKKACLYQVANVQDSDAAEKMQQCLYTGHEHGLAPVCCWAVIWEDKYLWARLLEHYRDTCLKVDMGNYWLAFVAGLCEDLGRGKAENWYSGLEYPLADSLYCWCNKRARNDGWWIGIGYGSEGFLSLRESHEKHVAETATRFTEMLEDMTTLSEVLREILDDVESKISLVKTEVTGSGHGADVSYKVKNWAQLELHRLGVKDLSSVIAAADGLLDYKLGNPFFSEFSENKSGWKNGKDNGSKFKPKADDSHNKNGQKNKGYFICDGPHQAKDCPKRETLNAIVTDGSMEANVRHKQSYARTHDSVGCEQRWAQDIQHGAGNKAYALGMNMDWHQHIVGQSYGKTNTCGHDCWSFRLGRGQACYILQDSSSCGIVSEDTCIRKSTSRTLVLRLI
ncbi:hypothetical protein Acr_09g0008990 [Actinidia rufa]|uniref:Uncharacterized protein n=1 Tax=Actinidia rufa TaxID=165716 RepID=A0A7J0F761_9ERIC|nr:hypothetical protein Acr_09g0008990 [Actinidia rufa]